MRCVVLVALSLSTLGAAPPTPPAVRAAMDTEPARSLLASKCVRVSAQNRVAVPFEQVASLLGHSEALRYLLRAYASVAPGGAAIAGSLVESAPSVFRYRSERGEPTEVQQLYSGPGIGESIEVVLYSHGQRAFGEFRSLTRVVAWRDGTGTAYRADVSAYPEHALLRFVARDLGFGRRYFRAATGTFCRLAEAIVPAAARDAAGEPASAGTGRASQ